MDCKITVEITGYSGEGKTTTVDKILDALADAGFGVESERKPNKWDSKRDRLLCEEYEVTVTEFPQREENAK